MEVADDGVPLLPRLPLPLREHRVAVDRWRRLGPGSGRALDRAHRRSSGFVAAVEACAQRGRLGRSTLRAPNAESREPPVEVSNALPVLGVVTRSLFVISVEPERDDIA